MRRLFTFLPYVGLLLFALALVVRALRTEGLDLPEFPAPPHVEFAGEVLANGSERLSGTVVDGEGQPVAEALVMADLGGELVWDYTDPLGAFELVELTPGEVRVTIVARKFASRIETLAVPATGVRIDLGQTVPPPPSVPHIGESDLEGSLAAAVPGRGLLGYEVQLIPVQPTETFGAPLPARTRVGADRTFRFEALLHGEYRVRILPPWAAAGSWPNLVEESAELFTHGPAVAGLDLTIHAGEIAGRLIDTRGEFVEDAMVQAAPVDAPTRPWVPVLSDGTGRFHLRDLPPGEYRLQVTAGEARLDERVLVLAGVTSEIDLDPLEVRATR